MSARARLGPLPKGYGHPCRLCGASSNVHEQSLDQKRIAGSWRLLGYSCEDTIGCRKRFRAMFRIIQGGLART